MKFRELVCRWWGGGRPAVPRRRRTVPAVEALEDRRLLSCNVISGYVYHDANDNGLFDPGETGLSGSSVELVNAGGTVVATAVSAGNGFYQFSADQTVPPGPLTDPHSAGLSRQTTNWSRTVSIPKFNPALGTLTEVEVINSGDLTGQIKVESEDRTSQTVTATVSGNLSLSGPGVSALVASSARSETFPAGAYDGAPDYGGTSGHDFGPQTVSGSKTIALTDPGVLALYTGGGSVTFTEKATGTSSATSTGGNLLDLISSSADGSVTVVYHYLPNTCLRPGSYTIVQTTDPPGYVPGMVTRGNVTPLPGSAGTHTIPVVLAGQDLTNNNFAELLGGSLSGTVYFDVNHSGVYDAGDLPIPNTLVTLTGVNDLGQSVSLAMWTVGNGAYAFGGLRPGSYTITESQPAGYLQGTNNLGSLGGSVGSDQFFVALGQGQAGVNYNFGEVQPIAVTNAPPSLRRHPPGLSKDQLISDGTGGGGGARRRAARRKAHHPARHRHG